MCVSGREGCFKTAHKVYGFPEHDKKIQHLNKKDFIYERMFNVVELLCFAESCLNILTERLQLSLNVRPVGLFIITN